MNFKHCTVAALVFMWAVTAIAQQKTNVVLILTDDQGWGDLSLHGNPYLETPNLDALAKSGRQFSNFYVSPLCAPTRASILTGRYHLKTGVVSVSKALEIMDTEETTLAEMFKANGYRTGIFGKWHNGQHYPNRPNDQGFDEFLGFSAGHWSNYFNTTLEHNNNTVKTTGFITDVLTDAALQFMETNKQQPFFCYIPYNAPHTPHQVPDAYFNKYKAKGLDDELASIYGMVQNVDDNVGRVLAWLKKNHLEENTIVVFMTDNGPNGNRYNGNMKGIKGSVHEGGVRVPFFISWKNNIKAGSVTTTPAAHIDLFATLRDLCKLKAIPGKPLDGMSLANVILQGKAGGSANRNLFTHVNTGMVVPATLNAGGLRNGNYRFVYEKNNPQLYHLVNDPAQLNNLAQQNQPLTAHYTKQYTHWFNQAAAPLQYNRPTVLSARGATIPVYEAQLTPGIKYKEGHGWAHDWVFAWNTTADSMVWEIDCRQPGTYEVTLNYLCAPADTGSRVRCTIAGQQNEFTIARSFYSKQVHSPDRVPRKEAYEMEAWGQLPVGRFVLQQGLQKVVLKALHVAGNNVAEVHSVQFKKLP